MLIFVPKQNLFSLTKTKIGFENSEIIYEIVICYAIPSLYKKKKRICI